MSGRYTAYHVYQNLSFQEADKAAARPYRLPEYHCAHSQRGYLFQFTDMSERNHFDAAVTTCCDEPVLNFQNKPQFAEASRPMKPRDCSSHVSVTGCAAIEVSVEDSAAMCADESAHIRRIRIKCPSMCPEFTGLIDGETFRGQYGTFRILGREAEEILILDYTPDQQIITDIYRNCAGTVTFNELFCNGRSLSFEVRGGLDFPGGCGCDCCGDLGAFPAPIINLNAPDFLDGGVANEIIPNIVISGDPACRGGEITGVFHGIYGSTEVSWSGPTIYHSDGASRNISRVPAAVGVPSNPSCCGGEIEWTATDGCGSAQFRTTLVKPGIADSHVLPPDLSVLSEGYGYSFTGIGACSYSSGAALDIETVCLDNAPGDLYRLEGTLVRNMDSTLRFEPGHACSGCCGKGEVSLSFYNGCGSVITAGYTVRRSPSDLAYQDVIGRVFKVERFYRSLSPIGYFYRVAVADLRCDGSFGEFVYPLPGYYASLEDCLAVIQGPSAEAILGPTGVQAVPGAYSCCFYSDNGLSSLDFTARIISVSGTKCCVIDTTNGHWINGGPDDGCCPN
jgi:hypothetical protein